MKRDTRRLLRRDCMKYMRLSAAVRFFSDLLAIAMPTLNAFLIGNMTDYLIALDLPQIRTLLPLFAAAMGGTILAAPLFSLWENLLLTKCGFAYDTFLMDRFIHKPLRDIQREDFGSVIERLEGDSAAFCWNTVLLYSRPAVIAGYAAVIGWTLLRDGGSVLFMLVLVLVPALPVLKAQLTGKKKARFSRELSEYNEQRRSMEADLVPSGDFLLNYRLEGLVEGLLQGLYSRYLSSSGNQKRAFDSRSEALDFLLRHGVPLCVLAIGGVLVSCGSLTAGVLLSGYLMLSAVEQCYTYGVELVEEIRGAEEYAGRIAMFYGRDERDAAGDCGPVEALRAERVSFSYEAGGAPAVNQISFSVPFRGCTRLTGPNGCGKSTMAFLLSGLYPPDQGSIRDQAGNPLSLRQLRRAVALQEQDGAIFSGTLQENLFLQPEDAEKAQALFHAFGLEKPLSYLAEANGANLSPGERKKLLLIRALLKPAKFCILDEPLNHLDEKGKVALLSQLEERKDGIVLVSHQDFLPDSCCVRDIEIGREAAEPRGR